MGDIIPNIALGRGTQWYINIDTNDPANSVFVIAAFNTSSADSVIKDLDTLAAIEADGNTAEVTNTNYARKILDDSDIVAFAPDDTNDRVDLDIPDQVFTAIEAGDSWTDMLTAYDADSTGGADSDIVPWIWNDFVVTPNGGDITMSIGVNGIFRAQ